MNRSARWVSMGVAALVALGLAGCIRPVETATPPTATVPVAVMAPTATLAPEGVPAGPEEAEAPPDAAAQPAPAQSFVEPFVLGRGQPAADLQVWYDGLIGPDRLLGYSYTGSGGFPCAGFLLVSATANNGAIACAPDPATTALASVSYISTSDGQPYTVTFGRVADPGITAVAMIFDDGSNQMVNPNLGGFMALQPDIFSVTIITAINAEGNTVIDNIPQVPAS